MQIVENSRTTLRAIGKNEDWLHAWILEKPSRLGLGDLTIKQHELIHYKNKGGRLDILAWRGDLDTYYEIEIMLGECDSDHGFRVLDYWARERVRNPNAKHVAVLVAEDLSGRYKTLIDTLPQFLPLIAIEIKVLRLVSEHDVATIEAVIVAQPDDLIVESGDQPEGASTGQLRDRDWWISNSNPTFIATVDKIAKISDEVGGPSTVDFTAKSYVSLRKGRRCWLPMWPRADGVYVYIPGGSDGSADAPSEFYGRVRHRLEEMGVQAPSWSYKYNGGANPIAFAISADKVNHSAIREILAEAYLLA
jgi:hypothetical protein